MQLVLLITFATFGVSLGSFGTVLIERIPANLSLRGCSRCGTCKRVLCWWELVPVLSYIYLCGKCRSCGHRIAWWYPVVEGGSAFLFVFSLVIARELGTASLLATALWALWIIAWIDARAQVVPDVLSMTLLVCVLVYGLLQGKIDLLSPLLAVGFFGSQWACSRGRLLGSGDIIVTGASGFLFGDWQEMFLAILLAYVCGAIMCIVTLLLGWHRRTDRIAFLPFWFCGVLLTLVIRDHPFIEGML